MKIYHWLFVFILGFFGVSIFFLLRQSIRLDEAQTIWVATKSLSMGTFLIAHDVHVPLYNTLIHFWILIFGTNVIGIRLISVFFFLVTLPVLFLLSKEKNDHSRPWYTIIFFTTSPFIMWYSSEARMYTLLVFVSTLHHLIFLRLYKSPNISRSILFFLVTVIGMYTHYFFMLLLISQFLFLAFTTFTAWRKSHNIKEVKFLFRYFFIMTTATLCFLPWIYYVIKLGSASSTQPLIPPPNSYSILQFFTQLILGFHSLPQQSILISLWPLLMISIFLFFTKPHHIPFTHRTYLIFVSFLPVIFAFIISFVKPVFLTRYLIFVTPTFFIFFTWIVLSSVRKALPVVVGGLSLIMLIGVLAQNFSTQTPVKENYSAVAEFLTKNAKAEDIIAISPPFTVYPIEYNYHGFAKIDTIPNWDRYQFGGVPAFKDTDLQQQILKYKQVYHKLFVVLSYDQGYEKKIRMLLDKGYAFEKSYTFSDKLEVRQYVLRYDIAAK